MRQNILPLFKKNQIISPFEIIIQKKKDVIVQRGHTHKRGEYKIQVIKTLERSRIKK